MKLSRVSFFKKTPKNLKVSIGRSGDTCELDGARLGRCSVELHYGTVLGTSSLP